ncbi:MAG: acyltransferase [Deltaproteobacteria bacterium]
MKAQIDSPHFASLDGLRGAAALIVVFTHCCGAIARTPEMDFWIYQTPLRILAAPAGAVQVFFALSGWVLAYSLSRRSRPSDTARYYLRRVLRIHPPYIAAVLLAWGLSFLYVALPDAVGLNGWFKSNLKVHLLPEQVAMALRFPGSASGQLPIGWSLAVEMIFSFLMPIFCLVATRLHWAVLVPVLVYSFSSSSEFPVLRWSFDFIFGMTLFLERERIAALARRVPSWGHALFFALTLALFTWPTQIFKSPPEILRVAIGSVFFVASVLYIPWVRRFFATKPMTELGRISYSLYLVHFPILLVLAPHLVVPGWPWLSLLTVLVGVVTTSLIAGDLAWRAVERPSMHLGRWLAKRIP